MHYCCCFLAVSGVTVYLVFHFNVTKEVRKLQETVTSDLRRVYFQSISEFPVALWE